MCALSYFSPRESTHIRAGPLAGLRVFVRRRAWIARRNCSTNLHALNEVSGPADGAADMTALHQFFLSHFCGGLAWLLPAGPRTEWSPRPRTRRVLPLAKLAFELREALPCQMPRQLIRFVYQLLAGLNGRAEVRGLAARHHDHKGRTDVQIQSRGRTGRQVCRADMPPRIAMRA